MVVSIVTDWKDVTIGRTWSGYCPESIKIQLYAYINYFDARQSIYHYVTEDGRKFTSMQYLKHLDAVMLKLAAAQTDGQRGLEFLSWRLPVLLLQKVLEKNMSN